MSTAISDPRRRWARRGFTLIEVIGAVAAFTIAFLAGSAAFARLLQQQNTTYHRTLAASAVVRKRARAAT
jgi:prepilin-type N-terminal cleavage/methylation domain-containing protein